MLTVKYFPPPGLFLRLSYYNAGMSDFHQCFTANKVKTLCCCTDDYREDKLGRFCGLNICLWASAFPNGVFLTTACPAGLLNTESSRQGQEKKRQK